MRLSSTDYVEGMSSLFSVYDVIPSDRAEWDKLLDSDKKKMIEDTFKEDGVIFYCSMLRPEFPNMWIYSIDRR